ncbi:zinc carboxypeptidase-like [Bacillus rossius redtenbacheri]|uniref:zinc carboxypeptidase-like n=1 Tax=Bacillus rossius redtenbacheri TaxID=93214 RepID=UPI002FDD9BE8
MWLVRIALLAAALAAAQGAGARFDNYRVYSVRPVSPAQLAALSRLHGESSGLSFWTDVAHNRSVHVMAPPHMFPEFEEMVASLGMDFEVYIEDVQKLIDNQQSGDKSEATFGWTSYHRVDEIHAWLRSLSARYPGVVTLLNVGKSTEGRDLLGVKVSYKRGNKGIFIEGGIHAREWIAPATVTYILNQLLTSTDSQVRSMAQEFDWYFFPSTNPDGYEYTHTTNRMWRKTRSRTNLLCYGADPNRNWGFHWNEGGTSTNPCADTYHGSAPFSEPETRLLADYISTISSNLKIYLAVHSYTQVILTPYGIAGLRPANENTLLSIGQVAAQALAKRYDTQYQVGNIVDIMYVATGSSADWVVGTQHVPLSFIYELRDTGRYGFLLPAEQIVPTGEETLDSLVALVNAAKKTF